MFAQGRKGHHGGITVIGARSDAEIASRLGLVVPATAGPAVIRNRIRRRLRAAFVAAQPASGFDVVVRADAHAGEAEFQQVVDNLKRALVGAGIECAG